MNFDQKYPTAVTDSRYNDLTKHKRQGQCCVCGKQTNWRDTVAMDFMCSDECTRVVRNYLKSAYSGIND